MWTSFILALSNLSTLPQFTQSKFLVCEEQFYNLYYIKIQSYCLHWGCFGVSISLFTDWLISTTIILKGGLAELLRLFVSLQVQNFGTVCSSEQFFTFTNWGKIKHFFISSQIHILKYIKKKNPSNALFWLFLRKYHKIIWILLDPATQFIHGMEGISNQGLPSFSVWIF